MPKAKQQRKKPKPTRIHNWGIWLIAIIPIILYVNTLAHDFALDDEIVLTGNSYTQKGLAGLGDIFSHDSFRGYFGVDGKSELVAGGRYRPLSLAFFAVVYEFFGLHASMYHLFNILFYTLLCCILFKVCRLLLPKQPWSALFITAIFAAHPVHAEVVANIKGLDEIFALLGGLIALYSAIKYIDTLKIFWIILAAFSLFLGLLAKEHTITFLVIIPLAGWIFKTKKMSSLMSIAGILLIPCLIFLIIRHQILGSSFGALPLELMNNPFVKLVDGKYLHMSYGERLGMIFYTYWEYLRLLFFPLQLNHDYYPMVVPNGWTVFSYVGLLLFVGTISWAVYAFLNKKAFAFGILVFLGTLFLVSNILFPIGTNMAERFLFMPSFGFSLFLVLFLKERLNLQPLKIGLTIVIVLFGIRTMLRNPVWKDNKTLFLTDVKTAPNSAKLNNAVGGVLLEDIEQASEAQIQAIVDQAITHLQKAISLHPNYTNSYLLLGNAYLHKKNFGQSVGYYDNALKLSPNNQDAQNNKAIAYRLWGKHKGETEGNLSGAIQYLNTSYELNPNDVETVRLLGVAYGNTGDHQKAMFYFKKATELAPENAAAWRDYSVVLRFINQVEEATKAEQKALQLNPSIFSNK